MITLKEHNLRPYEQLTQILEHSNKCAIVSATGTGKSYIAAKYIEDNDLLDKTLFVVPSSAIQYSWQKLFEQAHVITYTSLLKAEKRPDLSEVELIVCDEYHHLGAKKWGAAFKEFADGFAGRMIGLSATPIRYLDDGRDMTKEIFEDNVVYGYDLAEAINDSILPSFKYITSIYDLPHRVNEYKKKKNANNETTQKLIAKLDVACSKQSIKAILTENFDADTVHKVIVFVDKIKEIEKIEKLCKKALPKWSSFTVHSKMKKEHVSEEISAFENSKKSAFIFAVDIFNEGIHVNNVDGIIMFRKTMSPIVYLQQIGRGLTSNNTDKRITIVDFVANYKNLISYKGVSAGIFTFNNYIKKKEKQIIINDYAIEQGKILEKLSSLFDGFHWTEEEVNILKTYCSAETTILELCELLPNRSRAIIYEKVKALNLPYKLSIIEWTDEEIDILVNNYYIGCDIKKVLGPLIPNHKSTVIQQKLKEMKLYKNPSLWTKEELELLRKYNALGYDCKKIHKLIPTKTPKQIRNKIHNLKIEIFSKKYTEEEINILKTNYYPGCDFKRLCELLPKRSKASIRHKLRDLELFKSVKKKTYWTEEELELLRKYNALGYDCKKIHKLIPSHPASSIYKKLKHLESK